MVNAPELPIHIAVDGRPLDGSKNGYAAYTEWVVGALQAAGSHVTLVSNRAIKFSAYDRITRCPTEIFGSLRSVAWEQRDLLAYLNRQQPDVYFCGQNIGLPLLYRGRTRLVLGILDAIPQRFAEHYIVTLRDRIRYRWMQGAQARKADQIVTISQASQRDIKRFMGVSQVKTIYIRQLAGQSKVRMAANTPPVYVYIGGVEWRKRLDSVVQAFELSLTNHPGSKLYLIGSGYEAVLDKLASDKARPLIVLAGVLSEEKRNALIRRADAVLFPSLYEGYGLPIAEGLLQGVPVICGEGGSQREIGGVSAVYVDPTDVSAIVGAMEKVRTNAFRKSFKEGLTEQVAFLTNPALDDELVRAVVGRS